MSVLSSYLLIEGHRKKFTLIKLDYIKQIKLNSKDITSEFPRKVILCVWWIFCKLSRGHCLMPVVTWSALCWEIYSYLQYIVFTSCPAMITLIQYSAMVYQKIIVCNECNNLLLSSLWVKNVSNSKKSVNVHTDPKKHALITTCS